MSELYTAVLERLSRVSGVRGALVVDAEAGVPVVAELADDVAGAAVAALAASLFQRAASAVDTAAFGVLDTLQLEAERGHVVAAAAGELIVVVITSADAPLGLIRLEAHKAAEEIR